MTVTVLDVVDPGAGVDVSDGDGDGLVPVDGAAVAVGDGAVPVDGAATDARAGGVWSDEPDGPNRVIATVPIVARVPV